MGEGLGDAVQRESAVDDRPQAVRLDGGDHVQLVLPGAYGDALQAYVLGHEKGGGHLARNTGLYLRSFLWCITRHEPVPETP